MNTHRLRGLLIAALALSLMIVPASAAFAAPDVTALWLQAQNRVRASRPELAQQELYLAQGFTRGTSCFDGCRPGRFTKSASGIVLWFFDFRNQLSQPQTIFGHIAYGPLPKGFSKPTTSDGASGDEGPMAHPPQMTLRQAVAILQRAGYRKGFNSVDLVVLAGKRAYVFEVPDPTGVSSDVYVAVYTVSHEVKEFQLEQLPPF